jgi:hypothetical protein
MFKSYVFCLPFPYCKLYKESVLSYIFIYCKRMFSILENMCHLGWANQRGLTLNVKPKSF